MPHLTIDLPEAAMPWLTRQAENENTTPERYIISHVLYSMNQEESCATAQRQLEDILEERDKGPFVRITDSKALRERIMDRALSRIKQTTTHA